MPASFSHANGTVTFSRNPQRLARAFAVRQDQAETVGGVRYGYGSSASELLLTLHWPAMSAANFASLKTFFATTVAGMANTFTYTAPDGVTRTVRFADPDLSGKDVALDGVAVTVQLLEIPTAPSAPTGVSASANVVGGRIDVSWPSVSGATGYDIYWTDNGSTPSKSNGTRIAGVSSPYAHTGLNGGTTYKYCVVASYLGSASSESSVVTAVAKLTAPTGVAGVPPEVGSRVDLSWSAVTGATSYNIYWTSNGTTPSKTNGTKITGATSPYAHTGLTNGTTYKYCVTSVRTGDESLVSGVVSVIPAADGATPVWTEDFTNLADWTISDAGFVASGGKATSTDFSHMYRAAALSPNCSVEVKITHSAGDFSGVYLLNGAWGSGSGFAVLLTDSWFGLRKVTNGSEIGLADYGAPSGGVTYTILLIIAKDGRISVKIDGTERVVSTGQSVFDFDRVALYTTGGGQFDDVTVLN